MEFCQSHKPDICDASLVVGGWELRKIKSGWKYVNSAYYKIAQHMVKPLPAVIGEADHGLTELAVLGQGLEKYH